MADKAASWPRLALLGAALAAAPAFAQQATQGALPLMVANGPSGTSYSVPIQTLLFFTALSFLPAVLLMMTSFTRVVIVLSLMRQALGTQSAPPNQVNVGLSLFLTLFIMYPVISEINTDAYEPYQAGQITQQQFIDTATVPMREFMLKQTKSSDLDMFISLANIDTVDDVSNLPMYVVVPSFITSELKRAFIIGFLLYIPFLIIDMIVSSTLMSMGMIMLPPAMISLPFKLLLFVLVDGWALLFKTLIASFNF